jgi:hypothetical protein
VKDRNGQVPALYLRARVALVRIENPELSDRSLAPLKVNYHIYFSQETTILRRIEL